MPVMGNSAGALELLPNHLYPEPWLKLCEYGQDKKLREIASLPKGDPYEMYSDFQSWYRLLDPRLCDPARRYKDVEGGVETQLSTVISQAEHFHKQVIDDYYHTNTYAFFGEDGDHLTYGSIRWAMRNRSSDVLTAQQFKSAALTDIPTSESRQVKIEGHGKGDQQYRFFDLMPQDAKSDGTVSPQSGAAPKGKPGVKRVFKTTGYDHQGSYNNKHMVQLTQYLIAKMVAEKEGQC